MNLKLNEASQFLLLYTVMGNHHQTSNQRAVDQCPAKNACSDMKFLDLRIEYHQVHTLTYVLM